LPRSHGVIQNAWWDRETGAQMSCTQDPSVSSIGYNITARGGDSAWRLQRPTLGEILRAERGARVVTISLKDRTAVLLACVGGEAVTWLNESLGGGQTWTAFASAAVPAVKAFVDANPLKDYFGKSWTLLLPPNKSSEPDDGDGESPPPGWTRLFPH